MTLLSDLTACYDAVTIASALDGTSFRQLAALEARMVDLSRTEAVELARGFGIRLPAGSSKSKAVAQCVRKLDEQIGSAVRISAIGR